MYKKLGNEECVRCAYIHTFSIRMYRNILCIIHICIVHIFSSSSFTLVGVVTIIVVDVYLNEKKVPSVCYARPSIVPEFDIMNE